MSWLNKLRDPKDYRRTKDSQIWKTEYPIVRTREDKTEISEPKYHGKKS